MKFNGKKIRAMAEAEICLPRPDGNHLFLNVRALGLGESDEAQRLFPEPEPPFGFLTDESGKPLRDPDTGKVERGPIFTDPNYLARASHCENMRQIVKFVRALDHEPRIEFEVEGDPYSAKWYEAVAREIRESGLTDGDILLVLRRAYELGNLDASAIERAAEAFSERGRAQE